MLTKEVVLLNSLFQPLSVCHFTLLGLSSADNDVPRPTFTFFSPSAIAPTHMLQAYLVVISSNPFKHHQNFHIPRRSSKSHNVLRK